MIKQVILKDWRNYKNITVELAAGITFVVASNGVGKTSLVEAARWALFGVPSPADTSAIRAGADTATATVRLELPDGRILTVSRTLSRGSRRAQSPPDVYINDAPAPHENLDACLHDAYGADPAFLGGLIMPAIDRQHDTPTALGLEEHLGQYYGIQGLRDAANELGAKLRGNTARIRRVRVENATSAQDLDRLQTEVERLTGHAAEATQRHVELQRLLDQARERERIEAERQHWQAAHSAWIETAEALATRISSDLDRVIAVDDIEAVLEAQLDNLRQQIENIRVEVRVNTSRQSAIAANEERLSSAHDDCPVCRRPLDEQTVTTAHQASSSELAALDESLRALRRNEERLIGERERVQALQAEWRRIPKVVEPQPVPAQTDAETVDLDELRVTTKEALDSMVEARAAHLHAKAELEASRAANDAMRELETLYLEEATITAALESTYATLSELLNETIRPLAEEVSQRWGLLFRNRGALDTPSNGAITRTVDGYTLPFESFSTGERMSALIILRILVAQMVTKVDFCWFDEPLEHLDPDNRRRVASLLSQMTSTTGALRQVVVTTYEEPLARKLRDRDREHVKLVDVRERR